MIIVLFISQATLMIVRVHVPVFASTIVHISGYNYRAANVYRSIIFDVNILSEFGVKKVS
jgi:hypothetical protein